MNTDLENNSTKIKHPNWFVRFWIFALITCFGALIYFKFFKSEVLYQIDGWTFGIILLIVVLALSECFDNFSIGQFFSLSRNFEKVMLENKEIRYENNELRKQLIMVSTSVQQTQSNPTYVNVGHTPAFTVQKANDMEVEKEDELVEKKENLIKESIGSEMESSYILNEKNHTRNEFRSLSMKERNRIKESIIKNYIKENNFSNHLYSKRIFLAPKESDSLDPISKTKTAFDGCIVSPEFEIFIEVMFNRFSSIFLRDRLYTMLAKLNLYKASKNINVFLCLIFVNFVEDDEDVNEAYKHSFNRAMRDFQPAIDNGLLRVQEVNITRDDILRHKEEKGIEDVEYELTKDTPKIISPSPQSLHSS